MTIEEQLQRTKHALREYQLGAVNGLTATQQERLHKMLISEINTLSAMTTNLNETVCNNQCKSKYLDIVTILQLTYNNR